MAPVTPPDERDVARLERRRVEHVMGMPVSLALRGRHVDDPVARDAWRDCLAELRELDRIFSTYRADSYVSRLAAGEIGLAQCPGVVAEVLEIGERARLDSGGAFDVRRPGAGAALDPSGVVKGWAVQRAVAPLLALDDTDVCLSAGGDMVCHVAAGDHRPWQVGIEDPLRPHRVLAVVPVRRGAVATSGHAHRGRHVVDARTGRPPRGLASVTVIAADLTSADVDATTAYALGADGVDWLRKRPGRAALVVYPDGATEVLGAAA
jgi:thiamine biosynthesis lipoprotein